MIETIAIIVILLAIAMGIYALSQPKRFHVERRTLIRARPDAVYALIADLRNWRHWSPWEALDPELARSHQGAPLGVGAIYAYRGNGKVGTGRMEITEAVPPRRLVAKLDVFAPMRARNRCEWVLTPEAEGTAVTWTMSGPQSALGKLMGLVVRMEGRMGALFETGLAQLKSAAEADSPPR